MNEFKEYVEEFEEYVDDFDTFWDGFDGTYKDLDEDPKKEDNLEAYNYKECFLALLGENGIVRDRSNIDDAPEIIREMFDWCDQDFIDTGMELIDIKAKMWYWLPEATDLYIEPETTTGYNDFTTELSEALKR